MAQVEPMDVDSVENDFDDKENSLQNSNVYPNIPCTEKGYEELDVSEFSMKLRYSVTPASSPMSRSYTANSGYKVDSGPNSLNTTVLDNVNLTRSLNSTITKSDNILKSPKLPLQTLPTSLFMNSDKNSSTRRLCETEANVTVTITGIDNDDNLSLPSTSSSTVHTPEATTPTKEIPKNDSGSPIMRGLKSVLNMFRSSQSPIPPSDLSPTQEDVVGQEVNVQVKLDEQTNPQLPLSSTPIASSKMKDSNSSKRNSPLKDSVIFNDDLERELQWKDESTIFFKGETIPVHKLNFQTTSSNIDKKLLIQTNDTDELNIPIDINDVSNMDVSYKSIIEDKNTTNVDIKITNSEVCGAESDSEFVDCEPMYTKSQSYILETVEECNKIMPIVVQAGSTAHEMCLEDYIKPIDNIHTDAELVALKSEEVNTTMTTETNNLIYDSSVQCDLYNQPTRSNNTMTANDLCVSLIKDSNMPFPVTVETTACDFTVDNQVNRDDVTVSNVIIPMTESCDILESIEMNKTIPEQIVNDISLENNVENKPKNITHNISSSADFSMLTTSSNTQMCVDNKTLQVIIQTNNLAHQTYVEATNDVYEVLNNTEIMPSNVFNLSNNINVIKTEDSINSIIENKVNTQLLNTNDNLNPVNLTNNEKDVFSSINEETLLCIKERECSDLNITNEVNACGNIMVSTHNENINESMTKSEEINDVSKITLQLNEKQLASHDNGASTGVIKDYQVDTLSTTNIDTNNSINEKHNCEISNKNESEIEAECGEKLKDNLDATICINTLDTANIKYNTDKLTRDEFDLANMNVIKSLDIENNLHIINNSTFNLSDSGDKSSKMDIDLIVNAADSVQNNNVTHFENSEYPNDENEYATNITMHSLETNLHNIVQDQLLSDVIETKIRNKVEYTNSEVVVEELKMDSTSDVQLPNNNNIEKDCLQETLCIPLTNETCLQKLIIESNNKEPQEVIPTETSDTCSLTVDENFTSETVSSQITNVDADGKAVTLPDVLQTINSTSEPENLCTQTSEIDISNELTCLAIETKEIIKDILPSANNSPYALVTELDVHLANNVILQEIDKPLDIKYERTASPTISTKCTKKGYNIDFDKIDNPFTTKTNLRMSPPPDTLLKKSFTLQNNQKMTDVQGRTQNRKSYPDSKKLNVTKKRSNTAVDRVLISNGKNTKKSCNKVVTEDIKKSQSNNVNDFMQIDSPRSASSVDNSPSIDNNLSDYQEETLQNCNEKNFSPEQHLINNSLEFRYMNSEKTDDMNLAETDSRIGLDFENLCNMKDNIQALTDPTPETTYQSETENVTEDGIHNEVKILSNVSNATSSSRSTDDRDITVREVHTDDEDTIEGPFFEAEDLADEVKALDLEIEKDMMRFEDLPATSNNEYMEKDEVFIDAGTFEFLLNQNKNNIVADSGKESLFLKFDPLFAKRVSSDGVLAALNSIQNKQSTPRKLIKTSIKNTAQEDTPKVDLSVTTSMSDIVNSVTKPMMMVSPAVNAIVTPKISTPKISRRSLPSASPAMVVIDKLLSLSGNESLLDRDDTLHHSSRNYDASIALIELRQILAEKDIHVHHLRCESKELKERLTTLESQVKSLENESEERLRKVNNLNERLAEKTKINKSMAVVVEEYERTIACLIAETEQERKEHAEEKRRLISERDEQASHLACMEGSFSDLHNKYEKSKQAVLSMKINAETYKKSFKEFDDNLLKMQKNYDSLKQHATSKLNYANMELDKMNRAHEVEVLKLTAMIKRKELHITSLEESLSQKTKANDELTAICEELLNKVG